MRYKSYRVRYAKTGEVFDKIFDESQTGLPVGTEISETLALLLVNKWNQQNASSGFTYWIE